MICTFSPETLAAEVLECVRPPADLPPPTDREAIELIANVIREAQRQAILVASMSLEQVIESEQDHLPLEAYR